MCIYTCKLYRIVGNWGRGWGGGRWGWGGGGWGGGGVGVGGGVVLIFVKN